MANKTEFATDAARRIIDDVVEVQAAMSGMSALPTGVREQLHSIQRSARTILASSENHLGKIIDGFRDDSVEGLEALLVLLDPDAIEATMTGASEEDMRKAMTALEMAFARLRRYFLAVHQAAEVAP